MKRKIPQASIAGSQARPPSTPRDSAQPPRAPESEGSPAEKTTAPGSSRAAGSKKAVSRSMSEKLSKLSLQEIAVHIRTKQLSVDLLPEELYLDVVEYLVLDGYTTIQIANGFHVHPRTIERCKKKIRKRYAQHRDPDFVDEKIGQFAQESYQSAQYLRRIARDKNTPIREKVVAEVAAYRISADEMRLLQSLGRLPMAAHNTKAEVEDDPATAPGLAELEAECGRLARIGPVDENDEADDAELAALLARAKLAEKVAQKKRKAASRGGRNVAA